MRELLGPLSDAAGQALVDEKEAIYRELFAQHFREMLRIDPQDADATGKLAVTFENNLVTSLEQTEGTTDVPGPVRLVPAPIVIAY